MLNVVKNQRRGRIQLKYGTFSADIELPKEKRKMAENKATVVASRSIRCIYKDIKTYNLVIDNRLCLCIS